MELIGGRNTVPTEPESLLADALRTAGVKVEPYFATRSGFIFDFAVPEIRLGIEVDGPTHYTEHGKKRDRYRDYLLRREGWRILRINWQRVLHELPKTIRRIQREIAEAEGKAKLGS